MELTKCENGHYYNKEKFPSCPQCIHIAVEDTSSEDQSQISTAIPSGQAVGQFNRSIPKTVGWLMCIQGNMSGESFPIREGTNHIGRSTSMDIILLYENGVSREDHAVIQYDGERRSCILQLTDKNHYVALNDEKVKKDTILSDRDRITLGKCTLVFVPFCNKEYGWDS